MGNASKYMFVVLLFSATFLLKAQDRTIDSLRSVLKDQENDSVVAICLINIGDVYYKKGDHKNSILIGEKAYAKSLTGGWRSHIFMASELLKRAYAATGNYEKALFYYEEYKRRADSLINDEARQALTRAQLQYEYDKKEAVNEVKRKEKQALWQGEQRRRKITIYSICVGLLILAVLAYYIFKRYRERQRSHLEISRQKRIIEEKQKEILDSIRYAKRIQQSLMPTEKYIAQKIGGQSR